MFEQGLSFVLKKLLQDFVEDGDNLNEKVQVGVWSGCIILEDLVLKNSILSLVDVPVSLSYGYIGRLEIQIPWGRLGYEPVKVVIDRVNILIEPRYEWNPGAADKRQQAVKQAKLAAAEIFAHQRFETSSQKYKDFARDWFLNAFVGKFVDNIQVTLREVHVRYEDKLSCPSNFCIGISFESLHLQTRDLFNNQQEEIFSPQKTSLPQDKTRNYEKELNITGSDSFHKLVELNHLAVYWNPLVAKGLDVSCCSFIGRSPQEIQSLMCRTIVKRVCKNYDRPRHHYILNPVDIQAYIDMALNVSNNSFKGNIRVLISSININLEDRQLREIISMALNMANFSKLERFSEFRPKVNVKDNPIAWWKYAINAVMVQLQIDKKKGFSFKQFNRRIEDKLVYIELWKSRLISSSSVVQQINPAMEPANKMWLDRRTNYLYQYLLNAAKRQRHDERLRATLSPEEFAAIEGSNKNSYNVVSLDEDRIELLKCLEYDLSFEDLLLFRSLAERSFSLEARKESWLGGIISWATGGRPQAVSEEERRKLFEALKYDPDKLFRGGRKEVDSNEVNMIMTMQLKEGSVTLSLSSPDSNATFQTAVPFLQLKLMDLKVKTIIMGDGSHMKVHCSLQDFEGYEVIPSAVRNQKLQVEMIHERFIFRRILKHSKQDLKSAETESNFSFNEEKSVISTSNHTVASMSKLLNKNLSASSTKTFVAPLFSADIEISPNNPEVEVDVKMELEELEFWFSPRAKWLNSVTIFSSWPEDLKYWSEMEMKAMNQLADFKSRINAKLEYVMNNHANIIIEGRINAPILVIHDKPHSSGVSTNQIPGNNNSSASLSPNDKEDEKILKVLVVDLGLLTLHTERLAKAQRIQGLLNQQGASMMDSSMMRGPRSPVKEKESSNQKDWEILPNDPHNDILKTPNPQDLPDDLFLINEEFGLTEEHLSHFNDDPLAPSGRRSSIFQKYDPVAQPETGLLQDNPEFDINEEELFDVFQCKISQIEVYIMEVVVVPSLPSSNSLKQPNNSVTTNSGYFIQSSEGERTVIVSKFEINVEIQVSALPWDITLPPVKLFVDIPEINVQISSFKILQISQFVIELVNSSNEFIESNMTKITKFQEVIKQKQKDDSEKKRKNLNSSSTMNFPRHHRSRDGSIVSDTASVHSNSNSVYSSLIKKKKQRKRRSTSFGSSARSQSAFGDNRSVRSGKRHGQNIETMSMASYKSMGIGLTSTSGLVKSQLTDGQSRYETAQVSSISAELNINEDNIDIIHSRLKKLQDQEVESHLDEELDSDDDMDDDSFYSLEDNYIDPEEQQKALEELKFIIAQRESYRTKLFTDIRLTEADISKVSLHESLKQELNACELDLHQLKVSYVEMLMNQQDYLTSFQNNNISDQDKEAMINEVLANSGHAADSMTGVTTADDHSSISSFHPAMSNVPYDFKDRIEEYYSSLDPSTNPSSPHKRDLIHASVFKLAREEPPEPALLDLGPNKELAYVRVNINVINIDIQLGEQNELEEESITPFLPSSKNEHPVYRMSLAGLGLRLRHRVHDSKISCYLKEIHFLQLMYNPLLRIQREGFTAAGPSIPFITTDASYFSILGVPLSIRPYSTLGINEFMKLKYEINFALPDEENRIDNNSHQLKLNISNMAVNIDHERLGPLILWGIDLNKKLQEKCPLGSLSKPVPLEKTNSFPSDREKEKDQNENNFNSIAESVKFLNIKAVVKMDNFSVNLLSNGQPLFGLNMSSINVLLQSKAVDPRAVFAFSLADLSMYNLLYLNQASSFHSNNSPSTPSVNTPSSSSTSSGSILRKIDYCLGSRNMIFGRHTSDNSPFLRLVVNLQGTNSNSNPNEHLGIKSDFNVAKLSFVLDPQFVLNIVKIFSKSQLLKNLKDLPQTSTPKPMDPLPPEPFQSPAPNLNQTQVSSLHKILTLFKGIKGQLNYHFDGIQVFFPYNSTDDVIGKLDSIHFQTLLGQKANPSSLTTPAKTSVAGNQNEMNHVLTIENMNLSLGTQSLIICNEIKTFIKCSSSYSDVSTSESKVFRDLFHSPTFSFTHLLPSLLPDKKLQGGNDIQINVLIAPIHLVVNKENVDTILAMATSMQELQNNFDSIVKASPLLQPSPQKDTPLFTSPKLVKSKTLSLPPFTPLSPKNIFPQFLDFNIIFTLNIQEIVAMAYYDLSSLDQHPPAHLNNSLQTPFDHKIQFRLIDLEVKSTLYSKESVLHEGGFMRFNNRAVDLTFTISQMALEDVAFSGNEIYPIVSCGVSAKEIPNPLMSETNPSNNPEIMIISFLSSSLLVSKDFEIFAAVDIGDINATCEPIVVGHLLDLASSLTPGLNCWRSPNYGMNASNPSGVVNKVPTLSNKQSFDDRMSHPSSVPMAPHIIAAESTEYDETLTLEPMSTTVVYLNSFCDIFIKKVEFDVKVQGIQIWLPLVPEDPQSSCICASVSLSLNLGYEKPDFQDLLKAEIHEIQMFSVGLIFNSIQVYLADQRPNDLLRTSFLQYASREKAKTASMDSFDVFGSRHGGLQIEEDRQSTNSTEPSIETSKHPQPKVWLLQTEGSFYLLTSLHKEAPQIIAPDKERFPMEWELLDQIYGIKMKTNLMGEFNRLDIQAFLDYRPFLSLFEYQIKPIIEKVKEFESSLPKARYEKPKSVTPNSYETPEKKERWAVTIPITSIDQLLSHFLDISDFTASIRLENMTIVVLNDLYQPALSIARVSLLNTTVDASILIPSRKIKVLELAHQQITSEVEPFPFLDHPATPMPKDSRLGSLSPILEADSPMPPSKSRVLTKITSHTDLSAIASMNRKVDPEVKGPPLHEPALTLKLHSTMRVDYQNQKLIATEPVVEPVDISLSVTTFRPHNPNNYPLLFISNSDEREVYHEALHRMIWMYLQELLFTELDHEDCGFDHSNLYNKSTPKSAMNHLPRPPTVQMDESLVYTLPPPCVSLLVDKFNINVTIPLLEIVFLTIRSIESMEMASNNSSELKSSHFSLLTIRNETGLLMKYWNNEPSKGTILPTNSEEPLHIDSSSDTGMLSSGLHLTSTRKVSFAIQKPSGEYWPPLSDLSLEGVGCRLISLLDEDSSLFDDGESQSVKMKKKIKPRKSFKASKEEYNILSNYPSTLTPSIVLDLFSRNGRKMLTIRSTMRIYNSTHLPFVIRLMDNPPNSGKSELLWEAFLLPSKGIFIPAQLCNIPNTYFQVSTRESRREKEVMDKDSIVNSIKASVGDFPCPELVGLPKSTPLAPSLTNPETLSQDDNENIPSNHIKRRSLFQQQRGTVNSLRYYHWLDIRGESNDPLHSTAKTENLEQDLYSKLSLVYNSHCCNIGVESQGMPAKKQQVSANSMLRSITLLPPVVIVNLLATELSVALTPNLEPLGYTGDLEQLFEFDAGLHDLIPQYHLKPGESRESLAIHANEIFYLSILPKHDVSSVIHRWSSFVKIPRCSEESQVQTTTSLQIDIPYKNESKLTVQLDVVDKGGCRTVNIFLPYWIISSSFLPLQFQHDARFGASDKYLNGSDGLAPDQPYSEPKVSIIERVQRKRELPRGIGKARGVDGVILGPEVPLKGLVDFIKPHNSTSLRFTQPLSNRNGATSTELISNDTSSVMTTAHSKDKSIFNNLHDSQLSAYSIIQCGYSNKDRKQGRIRFRHPNTNWSSYTSLDNQGTRFLNLDSSIVVTESDPSYGSLSLNSPFFKEGKKSFDFGVQVVSLEPPFQRTKAIVIVDRYLLVNLLGQSVEVRQFKQDNLFTLHHKEEAAFWWRPSSNRVLQMRIARNGWSWSGKFSIDKEGEIPVRLRNDYDNTVFFVLVYVLKQGAKMSVIFKDGDKFSPYRFENHTVETFRIRQDGQNQYTNLLPYHSCAYAWDEPLAPHQFSISMLTNSLHAQDDWKEIGVFSFERLEYLQRTTQDHLMMRIVAQGPTRVLQIHDTRSTTLKHHRTSYYAEQQRANAAVLEQSKDGKRIRVNPVKLSLTVQVNNFGISVVDQNPEELIYIAVNDVKLDANIQEKRNTLDLVVGRFQIDNQLWSTPYPSLFHPLYKSGVNTTNTTGSTPLPTEPPKFITLSIKQDFEYQGIVFLPSFKFQIQPFDVNIEGSIIAKLFHMFTYVLEVFTETSVPMLPNVPYNTSGLNLSSHSDSASSFSYYDWVDSLQCSPFNLGINNIKLTTAQLQSIRHSIDRLYGRLAPRYPNTFPSGPNHRYLSQVYTHKLLQQGTVINYDSLQPTAKIYFQHFEVSQVRFNFSFNPVISSEIDNPFEMQSLFMNALQAILIAIGSTFAKIDNCPLRFQPFEAEHIYASSKGFADILITNYAIQAVKQSYLILFSSQFLGNPLQLVQTISEGLWDFMYMPTMGLMTSPEAFILGTLRGTSSLFKNVVASFCATTSHLSTSLQVGLLTLGVVDEYRPISSSLSTSSSTNTDDDSTISTALTTVNSNALDSNRALVPAKRKAARPGSILEGIKMGLIGVVFDPLNGFREEGMKGLLIGAAKGSAGLFARPLFTLLGALTDGLDRISFNLVPRFLANQKLRLSRSRPPRFFLNANIPLQIYSVEENLGLELLSRLENGIYRNEGYLFHCPIVHSASSNPNAAKRFVVVTKIRIMLLEDNLEYTDIVWQIVFKHLLSIEVDASDPVSTKTTPKKGKEMPPRRGNHFNEEPKKYVEILIPSRSNTSEKDKIFTPMASNPHIIGLLGPSISSNSLANVGIASSSTSTPSSSSLVARNYSIQHIGMTSVVFESKLRGEPVLHLYHTPQSKFAGANDSTPSSPTRTSKANPSASPNGNASAGLRLSHHRLRFFNHEDLIRILNHLLIISHELASPDIMNYLKAAGIDFEFLLSELLPSLRQNSSVSFDNQSISSSNSSTSSRYLPPRDRAKRPSIRSSVSHEYTNEPLLSPPPMLGKTQRQPSIGSLHESHFSTSSSTLTMNDIDSLIEIDDDHRGGDTFELLDGNHPEV